MRRSFLVLVVLVGLAGCQSAPTREPVAVGFTTAQVRQSLGRPLQVVPAGSEEIWVYRDFPGNSRDYIRGGWRRRVGFDPVRRSDVITYEPVDDRLFPNLRTHTIRVTIRDNRVARIESTEDP